MSFFYGKYIERLTDIFDRLVTAYEKDVELKSRPPLGTEFEIHPFKNTLEAKVQDDEEK